MSLITDLRAWLLDDANIAALVGDRVHFSHVPQKYVGPYLWYARSTSDAETVRELAPTVGRKDHWREEFSVEAVASEPTTADDLAQLLKALDGSCRLLINGKNAQAVLVGSQTDLYVPVNAQGDDGRFVSAVLLAVIGYGV